MGKVAILFCKCKLCGSEYLDSLPKDIDIDIKHIGRYANAISTTHDCSKAQSPLNDTFGVGEILGVVLR